MTDMPIQPVESAPGGDVVREQDKIMLVLSYLGLLALIPLLTVKDSEYVKWHAKQGLALLATWFVFGIAISIIAFIPVIGWLISMLGCVGHLGLLGLSIYSIVKAFQPTRWRIPVVSTLADKF